MGELRLDARFWLLLDHQTRAGRRAMTMEYFYFLIFIAAIGVLLALYGVACTLKTSNGNSIFARNKNVDLSAEAIPPLRKTISGLSEKEIEAIEFQNRIDVWQKKHEVRHTRLFKSTDPVTGKKYTYVPPKESRATLRQVNPQETVRPKVNPHRLRLIS